MSLQFYEAQVNGTVLEKRFGFLQMIRLIENPTTITIEHHVAHVCSIYD